MLLIAEECRIFGAKMIRRQIQIGTLLAYAAGISVAYGQTGSDLAGCRGEYVVVARDDAIEIPASIENGIILVDAFINGKGPLPMMIDTGAVNIVSPEAADAIGLHVEAGAALVQGHAGRQATAARAEPSELRLGTAILKQQPFLVLDLPRYMTNRGNRAPIAGFLGLEFFAASIVRLDYQGRHVTLGSPQEFRHSGSGVCVPFSLEDRKPIVVARANGVAGRFIIDSGSNAALTLEQDFAAKIGFGGDRAPVLKVSSAASDGLVENVMTRLDRFQLGEAIVSRPLAQFISRPGARLSSAPISGSIGSRILQQFILTFDYARHELWIEKSPEFGVRMSAGKTGFQAAKVDGHDLRIVNVIPDTPAAVAGLQAGDRITAIDGVPAEAIGLSEMAELSRRPDGATISIAVLRSGNEQLLSLKLRELLP